MILFFIMTVENFTSKKTPMQIIIQKSLIVSVSYNINMIPNTVT